MSARKSPENRVFRKKKSWLYMYLINLRFFFGVYVFELFEIFEKKLVYVFFQLENHRKIAFFAKKSPGCICI